MSSSSSVHRTSSRASQSRTSQPSQSSRTSHAPTPPPPASSSEVKQSSPSTIAVVPETHVSEGGGGGFLSNLGVSPFQIVHVVSTAVIIAVLFFYFKSQNKKLQVQLNELAEKQEKQEQLIQMLLAANGRGGTPVNLPPSFPPQNQNNSWTPAPPSMPPQHQHSHYYQPPSQHHPSSRLAAENQHPPTRHQHQRDPRENVVGQQFVAKGKPLKPATVTSGGSTNKQENPKKLFVYQNAPPPPPSVKPLPPQQTPPASQKPFIQAPPPQVAKSSERVECKNGVCPIEPPSEEEQEQQNSLASEQSVEQRQDLHADELEVIPEETEEDLEAEIDQELDEIERLAAETESQDVSQGQPVEEVDISSQGKKARKGAPPVLVYASSSILSAPDRREAPDPQTGDPPLQFLPNGGGKNSNGAGKGLKKRRSAGKKE